ncbi:MAG: class I SAM-dependent methyltransferase [Planctomycetia bacterium]|nr:class I SAM-dependent methyltransferase [Planctomycetia bacterium]
MPKNGVDKNPDRIRKMFGEIAPRYDFLNHFLSLGIDYSWRRKTTHDLFRLLLPDKRSVLDAPILDLATGTGDLAFLFLKTLRKRKIEARFDPLLREKIFPNRVKDPNSDDLPKIVGVDFVPEMLAEAEKKRAALDDRNEIAFMQGDGLDLPFESDLFSAVSIAFGLRNMSDTDRGIQEMVRVCRKGGSVAILEFTMPSFPIFSSIYRFYFRSILPRIGQMIARNRESAYHYLPSSVSEFDNIEKMKQRLAGAGLKEITVRSFTLGTVALYIGRKV